MANIFEKRRTFDERLQTRITKLVGSLAVGTATVVAPMIGTGPAVAQSAGLPADADAIFKLAYPADGPGAAVVVTRGGRVLYSAGRGLADLETRRPITPDTAFRLGSITKQFTAAVVLQLVAEKKVSLDDPLARFFPDWPQPGARATVRQLLNHSSGLFDYSKIPGYMMSEPTLRSNTTAELVATMRGRAAVSEPGQRWEYNNGGYVLLGAIIEKVTGKAWHDAVVERIARPLGLKTIAYAGATEGGPATARGYSVEDGKPAPARGVHISVAGAAGALVGSPGDVARWAQALHHGRVVDPALYQEMIRPARLTDGSTQLYGFGLRLRQIRGETALVHGGAGRGLDTDSVYVPSQDVFVAVFANSNDPATDPAILSHRLAALALGKPISTFSRADVAMPAIEPLFGAYRADRGPPFNFFAREDRLYLGRGDLEMEAFPAGQDRFFFGPDRLIWIRFVRQVGGPPVMEVHNPESARGERAVRTGPVAAPLAVARAVLQGYAGTYQTESVAVTVTLDEKDGLAMMAAGQPPLAMRPVSQTEFRIDGTPMRVVFHPEDGKVDRVTLYRGARELHGKRTGR